jgi:DNA repair exonuclease SbcCD ATPase subunit
LTEALNTIQNLRDKVKLYSWVENAQGLLETAKSEANKLSSASNQYNTLTSLVSSLAMANKTRQSSEWAQGLVDPLSVAKSELSQLVDLQGRSYDLSQLLKGMREAKSTVAHLDISTLGEDREALQTIKRRLSRFETDISELSPLISGLSRAKTQLNSAESELVELEAKRPTICPLCGGPYHKNNHEKEST